MAVFRKYRWHKIVLPLFISGLMLSCSPINPFGLASQEYTNINELSRLSNQRVVYLKGIVVNVAPFLDGGAYQIQDATGLVWIKTDKPLPPKGTSVSVKGELAYQAIFIGQDKLGESYVLELTQESDTGNRASQPPLKLPIQAQGVSEPIAVPQTNTTSNAAGHIELEPSPTPLEKEPATPISTPSPQPSSVEIPVLKPTVPRIKPQASPKATTKPQVRPTETPSVKPSVSPSPKPSLKPSVSPSPKPSLKPQSQASPKFNPDDQFLPHKRLFNK